MTKTIVCPYCETKTPCVELTPGDIVTCIRCSITYMVAKAFIREVD